jgi:creatinine amidohydrolase
LTSPELEALIANGRTTAVLPLGSIEQHGAHLPLATDTRIGDALAERFCEQVPEAVRLPTLALGCSSEHLGFCGTLSIRPETFAALLSELVTSLAESGFHRVFLFSAHGGNFVPLAAALLDLRASTAGIEVSAFTDLVRLTATLQRESADCGISVEAAGHHAGEIETSLALALDSTSVRRGSLAAGFVEQTDDSQAIFYPRLRAHAPSGVVGDPTLASAARGLRYLERWVGLLVAAYRGEKKLR